LRIRSENSLPTKPQRYDDTRCGGAATGVPAQYITGHQEFWGLDLIVSPAVLIPRPETEHVVEAVLEFVSSDKNQKQDQLQRTGVSAPHNHLRIVDVGTGSGAIALALAHRAPQMFRSMLRISRPRLWRLPSPMRPAST
jgi:release factor glutamine methyltransferase